jgi:hypothetical protein
MSSLFKKRSLDVSRLLLGIYDSPPEYKYLSISRGEEDRIIKPCFSLLAGCNVEHVEEWHREKIIGGAFDSRTMYVYAAEKTFNMFHAPVLSESQKQIRFELRDHILRLSSLFGSCYYTAELKEYINNTWDARVKSKLKLPRTLVEFLSRENLHVQKLAMAVHFSEKTNLEITLEEFKTAESFLDKIEIVMHKALRVNSKDEVSDVCIAILKHLDRGPSTFFELKMSLYEGSGVTDLETISKAMLFLEETFQIKRFSAEVAEGKQVIKYKIPTEEEQNECNR